MQIFAMASALLTILAGSWVGLRLLSLSRRTGQAPERLIGIGMLAFGAIAYPLYIVMVTTRGTLPHGVGFGINVVANAAYLVCLVTICLFTRTVFRPSASWSAPLTTVISLIGAAGCVVSLVHTFQSPGAVSSLDPLVRFGTVMISLAFSLCFLWTSIEAFFYRSAMRKRMTLGLADPVVVNRFGVWALGTGLACLIDLALMFIGGIGLDPSVSPIPSLVQSASGLTCSITWTLSFAPTEAYLNWVRKRAAQAS
jgi:hypothetical protein